MPTKPDSGQGLAVLNHPHPVTATGQPGPEAPGATTRDAEPQSAMHVLRVWGQEYKISRAKPREEGP